VIQSLHPYVAAQTLEGAKQLLPLGPGASQGAIKVLGGNGGGLFNADISHPYENPTALANFLLMLGMLLIPSGLVHLLGRRVGNRKHAWALWWVMGVLLIAGTLVTAYFEFRGNPAWRHWGVEAAANLEGKETRFGVFGSSLMAEVNSASSAGAMNTLDSFTPMGGLVALFNIALGEIIFGGAGAGLYSILTFVLLTVFIAGLLVGRTPEYLGKRVEGREIKYVTLAIIAPALSILAFSAWAVLDPRGLAAIGNSGPHGFTEIFYAFVSTTGNNGSSFGGLSANTPFYNVVTALAMFIGRFFTLIPMLAIAGSMAEKRIHPTSESTFPTEGPLFMALLCACILLVGALTFFPAFALGPLAEPFAG
jgi:K+-transporting ATPase ATPase A chain